MANLKLEHVNNMLQHVQKNNPELNGYVLKQSERLDKRVALAKDNNTKTDFMTLSEMNYYLFGYMDKSQNKMI